MQLPLQITARGVAVTPAIEANLWMAVHKLDSLYHRIMSCRVLLETVNRYGTGERIRYNVRIDLTLPGGELVVTRHPHEDLWTAVQQAFAAAQRRLQDYARRRRGEVKRHFGVVGPAVNRPRPAAPAARSPAGPSWSGVLCPCT